MTCRTNEPVLHGPGTLPNDEEIARVHAQLDGACLRALPPAERRRAGDLIALRLIEALGNAILLCVLAIGLAGCGLRESARTRREVCLMLSPEELIAYHAQLVELAREGLEARRARALKTAVAAQLGADAPPAATKATSGPTPLRIVADEGAEALVPPLVEAAGSHLGAVVVEPFPADGRPPTRGKGGGGKKVSKKHPNHEPAEPNSASDGKLSLEGNRRHVPEQNAPADPACIQCGATATHLESWGGQNQTYKCAAHVSKCPGDEPSVYELYGTTERAPEPPGVDPDPWGLNTQEAYDSEQSGDYEAVLADEAHRLRSHLEWASIGMPDKVPSKRDPTGLVTRDHVRTELLKWAGDDVSRLRSAVDRLWAIRGDADSEIDRLGSKLPASWRGTLDKLKKSPPHHSMLKMHESVAVHEYQCAARNAADDGTVPDVFVTMLEACDSDDRLSGFGRATVARTIEAASYDASKKRESTVRS